MKLPLTVKLAMVPLAPLAEMIDVAEGVLLRKLPPIETVPMGPAILMSTSVTSLATVKFLRPPEMTFSPVISCRATIEPVELAKSIEKLGALGGSRIGHVVVRGNQRNAVLAGGAEVFDDAGGQSGGIGNVDFVVAVQPDIDISQVVHLLAGERIDEGIFALAHAQRVAADLRHGAAAGGGDGANPRRAVNDVAPNAIAAGGYRIDLPFAFGLDKER